MTITRYFAALLVFAAVPATADAPTQAQQAEFERLNKLLASLHPQAGDIEVGGAKAMLHLGKAYRFIPADEAKRILTEGWGNPPEAVKDVLGMIFPAGKTFLDDSWGTVVTFNPSGYVADDDAKTADYAKVLTDARSGEDEDNKARTDKGFETAHLVGWAEPPHYDTAHHTVIWARDIAFGKQTDHTLNYDVRILGRHGVLSLNTVSTMSKLAEIRPAAANLGAVADFESGARYADFVPNLDKKAEYGVAGLVAAGVGAVAAKKLGLLALIALGGKKLIVVVLAFGAALWGRIKKLFNRSPEA